MKNEHDFIPFEQALILKEFGFNEECYGWYNWTGKILYFTDNSYVDINPTPAPLYQQAFEFLREKFRFYHTIIPEYYTKGINFNWQLSWYLPKEEWTEHRIWDGTFLYGDNGEYPSYKDAELGCLKKLIELALVSIQK